LEQNKDARFVKETLNGCDFVRILNSSEESLYQTSLRPNQETGREIRTNSAVLIEPSQGEQLVQDSSDENNVNSDNLPSPWLWYLILALVFIALCAFMIDTARKRIPQSVTDRFVTKYLACCGRTRASVLNQRHQDNREHAQNAFNGGVSRFNTPANQRALSHEHSPSTQENYQDDREYEQNDFNNGAIELSGYDAYQPVETVCYPGIVHRPEDVNIFAYDGNDMTPSGNFVESDPLDPN